MASPWKAALLCLVVCLQVFRTEAQCGNTFTANSNPQYINSPNYPQAYSPNEDCTYTIDAPASQRVHIDIKSMDLEPRNSENGCNDKLMFYSNSISTANKLGSDECGMGKVFRVSSGTRMVIRFTSDDGRQRSGYSIAYWAEPDYPAPCGNLLTVPIPTVVEPRARFLTLPTSSSSVSTTCSYKLEAPVNHNVVLTMQEWGYMDADGDCGTLEIFNGDNPSVASSKILEHDLCKKVSPFKEIHSMGRNLVVRTTANAGAAANKFSLRITSKPQSLDCSQSIALTASPYPTFLYLQSYTNVGNNANCNFLLTSYTSSMSVRIYILKKADGSNFACPSNLMTAYNGPLVDDSKKLTEACILDGMPVFASNEADALMVPGSAPILVEVTAYPRECNAIPKTISIPSNGALHHIKPDMLYPGSHCIYRIEAPSGDNVVQAKAMSMLTSADDDCVTVYDGTQMTPSNEIFRECGRFMKMALSTGRVMTVEILTSMNTAHMMGSFQFSFYSTQKSDHCMDTTNHLATRTPQNLSSPGYAIGKYPLFVSCSWRFVSYRPDFVVVVEVTYSDLPEDCTDYAFVNDGEWDYNPKLGEWCGQRKRQFRGTGQTLMLNFRSDGDMRNHKGFEIKYYADEKVAREIVEGTNVGLIAGILTAIVVGVSLIFLSYILCCRNRKSDAEDKKKLTS